MALGYIAPDANFVKVSAGAGLLGRSDVSSAPRDRAPAPEPEVPSGKAKLAGLLFGDAASSSSRARPTRPPSAAKKVSEQCSLPFLMQAEKISMQVC